MEGLKKKRTEMGMTQVETAKAIGVSLATYLLWERGVGNPNPENLKKLKAVLEFKG